MHKVLFLHNSSTGSKHPAQPHIIDPTIFFEKPERLAIFVEVAKEFGSRGVHVEEFNSPADEKVLELVHPRHFLDEFAEACRRVKSGVQEFGSEFFVGPESYTAACTAVGCAQEGVDRIVTKRATHVVCGCRPPGHHARPAQSMGFCGLSTAAIAALYAKRHNMRVFVFDYDVHSGNGTIEALVGRSDIMFAEIRTMTMDAFNTDVPFRAYPYPSGSPLDHRYRYDYVPSGGNLILEDMSLGTTGERYLDRFKQKILPEFERFSPDLLILSAGFDCMKDDPLGDLGLERHHIATMVHHLVSRGIPSLTILEGGYDEHNIRQGLAGHFEGML